MWHEASLHEGKGQACFKNKMPHPIPRGDDSNIIKKTVIASKKYFSGETFCEWFDLAGFFLALLKLVF